MDKRPNVLILGVGEQTEELIRRSRQSTGPRYQIVGCLSLNGACAFERAEDVPLVGASENLRDYLFRNPVDIVLVSARCRLPYRRNCSNRSWKSV